MKESGSAAESVKSEKLTEGRGGGSNVGPAGDRGMKRDASTANIRTPSLQEGKKMKMQ